MEERNFQIEELVVRVLEHKATSEEILYFTDWIKTKSNRVYFEKLKKIWNLTAGGNVNESTFKIGLEEYCKFIDASIRAKRRIRIMRIAVSAAAIFVVALFTMLLLPQKEISLNKVHRIRPLEGVVLKLSDNQEINILEDSLPSGYPDNHFVKINKTALREIIYEVEDTLELHEEKELIYNEIIVPAGERFVVQLSDGTKVWVNSESSLRFPTFFGKDLRCVEARGNVYFEVAKDTTRPFIVESREMKTEVLGTSFEINTYGDNGKVSATLVEGSIRVKAANNTIMMKPHQQFIYDTHKGIVEIVEVDANRKVRWKDGVLVIDSERFEDVVWKLERWYGVSIVNKTGLSFNQLFSGEFDREDIHSAIKTMCVNLNISYVIVNEVIYLTR